jgi:stringent starvation protein B
MAQTMTSSRPYLIRALYQWIVDNGLTPYLMVDAAGNEVQVPRDYVEGGRIILNIAPMAVSGLTLGNDDITFSARFSGNSMTIVVPVNRVLAVYAKENGQGMMFGEEGDDGKPPKGSGPKRKRAAGEESKTKKRPRLRVVK